MPVPHTSLEQRHAGFTVIELVLALGLMALVMGVTLGGLNDVRRSNDAVLALTSLNDGLRTAMDLMVRDLLQVGSGLPPGHSVTIPNGDNATRVRLPAPPGTSFETDEEAASLPAVIPWAGRGPTLNAVSTDVLTVLTADNSFVDVALTAVSGTTVTVAAGPTLDSGPDRVTEGQLMMVYKGSQSTLVQVTDVDAESRVLTFASGDSLNINQPAAEFGSLLRLNEAEPANTPSQTFITRIRMITYYLDTTTDPHHPRLMRRINNGHPTDFSNDLGTAVALDVENLQFTYDISNGTNNPGNVEMTDTDTTEEGTCDDSPCAPTQVRKVNVMLTGRSREAGGHTVRAFHNTLRSQVSLRGMAFVDEYRSTF